MDAGSTDAGLPDGGCGQASCQCTGAQPTRLSGTVYSPSGLLPIAGASVFVPAGALPALPAGSSCRTCADEVPADALAWARTGPDGRFTIDNVPDGANIPLVVQLGRWRRQVVIADVQPCVDNPVPHESTRLPSSRAEGELPKIAVTTGGGDALECFVRKLGIADSEFSNGLGDGAVHLYAGTGGAAQFVNGDAFVPAKTLWDSLDALKKYDLLLLSCEGGPDASTKSLTARQNLKDYADQGGRVLASHYHSLWIEGGPAPWPSLATFQPQPALGDVSAEVDPSTPRTAAFISWLTNVSALTFGKLPIKGAKQSALAVNAPAQAWLTIPDTGNASAPVSVQAFSFTAPAEAGSNACGEVFFTDLHAAAGDVSQPATPFPSGCGNIPLSAQQEAEAYLVFQMAGCLAAP